MARVIDTSKLENIKKATIDVVVEEGIKSASVAKIARQAGVSVGYFYRFYLSKDELIQAIFKDLFQHIINQLHTIGEENQEIKQIIRGFISSLFEEYKTDFNKALFMLKIMTDYSFKMSWEDKQTLNEISEKMLEKGHKTGEINPSIDKELLYTLVVGTTYFFINMRQREVFNPHTLDENDVKKITQLYIKALA